MHLFFTENISTKKIGLFDENLFFPANAIFFRKTLPQKKIQVVSGSFFREFIAFTRKPFHQKKVPVFFLKFNFFRVSVFFPGKPFHEKKV